MPAFLNGENTFGENRGEMSIIVDNELMLSCGLSAILYFIMGFYGVCIWDKNHPNIKKGS